MAKELIANIHYDPNRVEELSKEWGKRTKASLALQLAQLGLSDRGKLISSLSMKLRRRFGDVESVRFEYLYYGLFHDVGAENAFGKGVTLPAMFWKAKGINPNIEDLADKIGGYYADVFIKNIELKAK